MADNYIEKKFDEFYSSPKKNSMKMNHSLDSLLLKNRSTRGFDHSVVVDEEMLRRIVASCTKIGSACNQQVLRFRLVTKKEEVNLINSNVKMGAWLPDLHLPLEGTEPRAFIICCSTVEESRYVDVDLGIAAQTMLLKATDMGLNGLMLGAFNKENIKSGLNLQNNPLLVIAIGKSIEKAELVYIEDNESHKYYRENGVHYVPKVKNLVIE